MIMARNSFIGCHGNGHANKGYNTVCIGMVVMVTYILVKFGRSASAFGAIVSSLESMIVL